LQEFSFRSELQLLLCYPQFLIGFRSSRMWCHITGLLTLTFQQLKSERSIFLDILTFEYGTNTSSQHVRNQLPSDMALQRHPIQCYESLKTIIFSLAHTATKSLISTNQYQCYTQFKGIVLQNGLQEKQERNVSDKWNLIQGCW
jgi:hypothetical protein